MKTVVNSMLKSIPSLINVLLISLLFYLVFGILSVQLFKGTYGRCNDDSVDNKSQCTGTYVNEVGETVPRVWDTPPDNMNNILSAMMTLFEVSSLEMWPDAMFRAMDSRDVDE